MKSMYISSGDTTSLLSGITTESHRKLLRRFVSDEIPIYNSYASPIDALRSGKILEDRFCLAIDDRYIPQYKVVSEEMNVCYSTLDFAEIQSDKVVDFIELKTANLLDYQSICMFKNTSQREYLPFILKKYKHNIDQVQFQLFCSGLEKAKICFLEVQTYNDEENYERIISEDEYVMFEIPRIENIISKIRERLSVFQTIKDYYVKY